MTQPRTANPLARRSLRAPVLWGVLWGASRPRRRSASGGLIQRRSMPLSLVLIAAVYIGFAVAHGRGKIIAVDTAVAGGFVVLAAVGVTGPAWLLVVGFIGHGFKDLWQHRRHYVANTRWWPPFCLVVDWVAAAVLVVLLAVGVPFHS